MPQNSTLDLYCAECDRLKALNAELVEALEMFADEDAWMPWDDRKGAFLKASFKGAGEPWLIARAAIVKAREQEDVK